MLIARRRVIALAMAAATVALPTVARAGSPTGSLVTAVDYCQTHVNPSSPNTAACTVPLTEYAVDQANLAAVNNAVVNAQTTAEIAEPGDLVAPLEGHALSLLSSTVVLRAGFSVDYLNVRPTIYPVGLGNGVSTMDSPQGFKYNNTAHLYWDPNGASGRNGKLDGLITYNLYSQSSRYVSTHDFWATTQVASVTPRNGARLKEVKSNIAPNDYLESVEASPFSMDKYGSSGSMTLSASLKGEMGNDTRSGGAELTIGRTWNFAEGVVGGGRLSNQSHEVAWRAGNRAGTSTAKGAEGVETWRVPVNKSVFWYISGLATCKSC